MLLELFVGVWRPAIPISSWEVYDSTDRKVIECLQGKIKHVNKELYFKSLSFESHQQFAAPTKFEHTTLQHALFELQ